MAAGSSRAPDPKGSDCASSGCSPRTSTPPWRSAAMPASGPRSSSGCRPCRIVERRHDGRALLDAAARLDLEHPLDPVSPHAVDDIVQVADGAGVIGDDRHPLADAGPGVAGAAVDMAMLLAELGQPPLRVLGDQREAAHA